MAQITPQTSPNANGVTTNALLTTTNVTRLYCNNPASSNAHTSLSLYRMAENGDWVPSGYQIDLPPGAAVSCDIPTTDIGEYQMLVTNGSSVPAGLVAYAKSATMNGASFANLLTVPAGVTASGAVANDFSGSTGGFKTSTGTNILSGNTILAANKNLSCGSGTTAVDLSAGTGSFKPTAGVFISQGGMQRKVTSLSTATTPMTGLVSHDWVTATSASGAVQYTLPSPAAVGAGWRVTVTDVGNNATAITIARNASEKINFASSSYTLPQGTSKTFITDGTDWFLA